MRSANPLLQAFDQSVLDDMLQAYCGRLQSSGAAPIAEHPTAADYIRMVLPARLAAARGAALP